MLFINIWVWLSYSVAWHRSYLVQGEDKDVLKAYLWNRRQLHFFRTGIKIFLLMIPAIFIFPFFGAREVKMQTHFLSVQLSKRSNGIQTVCAASKHFLRTLGKAISSPDLHYGNTTP